MARCRHFHCERRGEIVSLVAFHMPAGHAAAGKSVAKRGHLLMQIVRHWRASGFVIGQKLVTPALRAGFIVKHRDGVCRLTVTNQLLQRVQTGIHARRALHRMYPADQV